jgi:hypothetical protein
VGLALEGSSPSFYTGKVAEWLIAPALKASWLTIVAVVRIHPFS